MTEENTNEEAVEATNETVEATGQPGVQVPAGAQVPGQDLNQGGVTPTEEAPAEEAPVTNDEVPVVEVPDESTMTPIDAAEVTAAMETETPKVDPMDPVDRG